MTMDAIYIQERANWQAAFDSLLQFGSEGVLKDEILQAKKIFFSRLGSTHEMREELYEITSRSFLEWYLFDYQTWVFSKSPAVVYATLGLGTKDIREAITRSLFDHWSLYEVKEVSPHTILLEDLLFKQKRKVLYDSETPDSKAWQVRSGQIIQARLFELQASAGYLISHLWIHVNEERAHLKKICEKQSQKWSRHKTFLIECLETIVRSHSIQNQTRAARTTSWLYNELEKKYA